MASTLAPCGQRMAQPERVGKGADGSYDEAETRGVYGDIFLACVAAVELEQVVLDQILGGG